MDILTYNSIINTSKKVPLGSIVEAIGNPGDKFLPADGSSILRSEYQALDALYPGQQQVIDLLTISAPYGPWYSIAYGNNSFVIVGSTQTSYSTSDNVNWSSGTLPSFQNWRSVAYGGGTFVALGVNNGTQMGGMASYSDDNGATWSSFINLLTSRYWQKVVYGNGKFIIYASGATAALSSSDLGRTYQDITLPEIIQNLIFDGTVFVAIGNSKMWTSVDGAAWTEVSSSTPLLSSVFFYGNGYYITTSDWQNRIFVSSDLLSWTQIDLPVSGRWRDGAYGDGLFIIVDFQGAIITSTNAVNWTAAPANATSWYTIAYDSVDRVFMPIAINSGSGNVIYWTPASTTITLPDDPGKYVLVK